MNHDDNIDDVLRGWAQQTVAATRPARFTVPDTHTSPLEPPRPRRLLLPLVAAATVLVLVAAAVVVQQVMNRPSPHVQTTRSPAAAPIASGRSGCPARLPEPGADDPHPAPQVEPLFPRPVISMTVCSYARAIPGARLSAAASLDTDLAARVSRAINQSPAAQDGGGLDCLIELPFQLLLARDRHGTQLSPVTLTPGCEQVTAYNGFATRYISVDDPTFSQADAAVRTVLPSTSTTFR